MIVCDCVCLYPACRLIDLSSFELGAEYHSQNIPNGRKTRKLHTALKISKKHLYSIVREDV